MLKTNWRPISGYHGKYEVSDTGLIRSIKRTVSLGSKSRLVPAKILKKRIDRYGYETVGLNDYGVKWFKVHRLVAIAFIGKSELTVNHKDFNKLNNNIYNLEFMTFADNISHFNKSKKRKLPRGENHHRYKLSSDDKLEIKKMKKNGFHVSYIGSLFNIHPHTVYKVVKNVG